MPSDVVDEAQREHSICKRKYTYVPPILGQKEEQYDPCPLTCLSSMTKN